MATVLHLRSPAAISSFFFFLLLLLFLSPLTLSAAMSESEALLLLKKSFTNATRLGSWNPDSPACGEKGSWVGVVCFKESVMGLRLGNMGLSGKIDVDSLNQLTGLRTISFIDNAFSGPIPGFDRLGALKALYLSGNQFSGEIPPDFFSKMESLKKIWLSRNSFTGPIPTSLAKLTHLIELHLEDNGFSGSIPSLDLLTLKSFNVSNNDLEGEIPASLKSFRESSFAGNSGLCGAPVATQCGAAEAEGTPAVWNASEATASPVADSGEGMPGKGKAAIVAVAVVVLVCVVAMTVTKKARKQEREFDRLGREVGEGAVEVQVRDSSRKETSLRKNLSVRKESPHSGKRGGGGGGGDGGGVPKLTIVNEERGVFGMPDLMKAAAEVLGNGGLGSSYKAVMANGLAVVVKRMREMSKLGDEGFEAEMRRLGMLRHANVLPPLAFHFRKEEKLLVYEYIARGSLLYLLHGDRGPNHDELNWPARLRIVRGIARGMAYLHTEFASSELPHGNLKSSNVLLDVNLEPLLTDYGYRPLVTPQQASQAMFAYKSPESIHYGHVSHKSDVYCLGVVILEILTGKYPSQYLASGKGGTDVVQWVAVAQSEKTEFELFDPEISGAENSRDSMERLLQLGAACADSDPNRRPDMKEAARRAEEIAAEEEGPLSRLRSARGSIKEPDEGNLFAIS